MYSNIKITRGYLYLANLNPTRGTESGKIRPVVVVQSDYLNDVQHPSTWILPCTTNIQGNNLLRVFLPAKIALNDKDCEIMIDQSSSIDNKRFVKQLGPIPKLILKEVDQKLMCCAGISLTNL